ncbi:MAG: TIR domain-containing protein [Cyclobacterium sp.]|uniref:TIR domain-containing protein n=1 Tax=Cyclobacterium sp. TaxID=1966343 RepID=UPI0039708A64
MYKRNIEKKSRNCFVSYHHDRDQKYISKLRGVIREMKVADHSLKDDIGHFTDETIYKKVRSKMRYCSVTVVLIGERTGYRRWIDWEIWASLRGYTHPYDPYKSFKPNGLLGIFLPTQSHSIPDRLQDNLDSGYAVSMKWKNLERDFESKVNYAYWNRTNVAYKIDNSRERQDSNYSNFLGFRI